MTGRYSCTDRLCGAEDCRNCRPELAEHPSFTAWREWFAENASEWNDVEDPEATREEESDDE